MDKLTENTGCYAKEEQRRILFRLFKHETIAGNFFLTGGTAISVFYLHHRYSKDIERMKRFKVFTVLVLILVLFLTCLSQIQEQNKTAETADDLLVKFIFGVTYNAKRIR